MKILCFAEVNENGRFVHGEPEKVYIENAELVKVESFFNNAQKLRNQAKTLSVVEQNKVIRMDANFHEISAMGFVHVSELDKFLEKKIVEIENRITIGFYWKRLKAFFKRKSMWVFGRIGYNVYKESQK